jgi:hypothetical protein
MTAYTTEVVTIADSKLPIDGIIGGLDLSQYQGERPCKIYIVREPDGSVSVSPATGYRLEKEVDIPARQTITEPILDSVTGEPILDDNNEPLMEEKVVPITSVTVKTWAH